MPPRPRADRRRFTIALALGLLLGPPTTTKADDFSAPRMLRPVEPPVIEPFAPAVGLTSFEPAGVSSRIRRLLLQYEALVTDEAWDEAIDLVERLQAEASGELTSVPETKAPVHDAKDHERFVPISQRRQELVATLPPAGLEAYRSRVDRSARERLLEATSRVDAPAIERLVRDNYASTPAADALLALGELALERGDFVAARRWHQQLHPLLRDPYGRPAAASLVLVDPAADPLSLRSAWSESERPSDAPRVPSDEALLPTALSRLALTSIREGDLRRAAAEMKLLRALAPDAEGRIAGRVQPLAPALEAMLNAGLADQGSEARYGELVWGWPEATSFEPAPSQQPLGTPTRVLGLNAFGQVVAIPNPAPQGDEPSQPILRPVVDGTSAFYVDKEGPQRLDLTTGQTEKLAIPGADSGGNAFVGAGDYVPPEVFMRRLAVNGIFQREPIAGPQPRMAVVQRLVDPELVVDAGVVYARVTEASRPANIPQAGIAANAAATLVGVKSPSADEPPTRFSPPTNPVEGLSTVVAGYAFVGAPALRGDRLYIAVARPGARTEIAVACYAAPTGRFLWKTDLGSGDPASLMPGIRPAPPIVRGDTVYLATNLGAVAALDASSGELRWLARYPRDAKPTPPFAPQSRSPAACFLVGDQLLAAPEDSRRLFAWDASTGIPLWDADRPADAQLTGIVRGPSGAVAVLAGRQLAAYDTLTGRRTLLWPESPRSGVRGLGQAAIVGGEVFWPTRDAIFALDPKTGALTRSPIDLASLGGEGANLVATDFGLLVCGANRLRLLTEADRLGPPEPAAPVSRLREAGQNELASSPR